MSVRNKFLIILGVIFAISLSYYLFSTPRSKDLVLIGTVDSNQVVVSPQIQGRIVKLLVDEGTQVKQGDLIALLDPSELQAQERAASAMTSSMRSKVAETRANQQATTGTTSSDVTNAQARVEAARAQLAQAEATLQRVQSDSRRMIELAKQGVASDQDRVPAEGRGGRAEAPVRQGQRRRQDRRPPQGGRREGVVQAGVGPHQADARPGERAVARRAGKVGGS